MNNRNCYSDIYLLLIKFCSKIQIQTHHTFGLSTCNTLTFFSIWTSHIWNSIIIQFISICSLELKILLLNMWEGGIQVCNTTHLPLPLRGFPFWLVCFSLGSVCEYCVCIFYFTCKVSHKRTSLLTQVFHGHTEWERERKKANASIVKYIFLLLALIHISTQLSGNESSLSLSVSLLR